MASWREKLRENVSNTCKFVVKHGPSIGWGSAFTCSAAAVGGTLLTAGPDPAVVGLAADVVTKAVIPAMCGGVTGIAVGVVADKFKDYCMEHYTEWYEQVVQQNKSLEEAYKELPPEAKGEIVQMIRDRPDAQEIFAREGLLNHLVNNGGHRLSHAMDSAETISQEVRATSSQQPDPQKIAPGQ